MKRYAIIAGMLALALMVGACARPAPTPTPAATPLPTAAPPGATLTPTTPRAATPIPATPVAVQPTGELRIGVAYVGTESLDPIMGPGSGIKFLAEPIFDFLVGVDLAGNISPETGLAHKWEMTPDARKWTFFLRKGIKFHNGDELTAEDVKFTLERVMGEKSQATYAAIFRRAVDRMEIPDPYTLVIHTKEPAPLLIYNLVTHGGAEGLIVPKKYIQQVGDEAFARKPIGTGPYRFKEQVFGSYVKLEATDRHWLLGVPQFKTITILAIPEATTRMAALKLGQADIIELERENLAEAKKLGFRVAEQPYAMDVRFLFHQQWDPVPVADKKVRLALMLGMNRPEILQHIFMGMGEVGATAMHAPFTIGYDPALKPYPFDPEQAKKLLSEAGYAKGLSIDMYSFTRPGVPEQPKMMEAIAGYWDKIGVKGKLIPTDYGAFRPLWRARKIPGAVSALSIDTRVWTQPLQSRYYQKSEDFPMADRPDIHAVAIKAGEVLGEKEREEVMRQLHRMLYDDVTLSSVAYLSKVLAFSNKVESWTLRPVPYSLSLDTVVRRK